jgi:hypothetical protein
VNSLLYVMQPNIVFLFLKVINHKTESSKIGLLQICNMHVDPRLVVVSLGVQSFFLCLISFIAAPVCELAQNFVAHTKALALRRRSSTLNPFSTAKYST